MDILRTLFTIWPHESTASSVEWLSIKIMKTTYAMDDLPPRLRPQESNDRFLQNLTRLSLHGGYFDWNSAAFRGLEHLQLVSLAAPASPTLTQFAAMLRSSSQLRTLCLGDIRIRPDGVSEASPIYFEHLWKLSIMSFSEIDLTKVLRLILPGSRPLTLHMNYELIQGPPTEAYIELFRRSRIESIYFHSRISRITMSDVFTALPHLRHLYISRNKYLSTILSALSAAEASPTEREDAVPEAPQAPGEETLPPPVNTTPPITHQGPCPHLETVHFHDCKFKLFNEQSSQVITEQPHLTIRLQFYDPPHFESIFLPNGIALVSGNVDFQQLSAAEPPDDIPFYGLNRTDTYNSSRRTHTNIPAIGTLTLDDAN